MDRKIKKTLEKAALQYETETFLFDDPSFFMHIPADNHDKEIMAFIASCLSYGRRELFFPKIQYILDSSEGKLSSWLLSDAFKENIPDNQQTFYRLYNNHTVHLFLDNLKNLLVAYGSMENFARLHTCNHQAITLIEALCTFFNTGEHSHIVPRNTLSSCKRLCMFLRWMVRNDSPVDLGLWSEIIDKRTLIMPLDTHVIQEANRLGLITTKSTSMKAANKLTAIMLDIFPEDPLKGDFALFGYGVNH